MPEQVQARHGAEIVADAIDPARNDQRSDQVRRISGAVEPEVGLYEEVGDGVTLTLTEDVAYIKPKKRVY